MLDKSIRELDRERTNLQSQEKKLIADIKKMAKQNQMGAVKVRSPSFVFSKLEEERGLPTPFFPCLAGALERKAPPGSPQLFHPPRVYL